MGSLSDSEDSSSSVEDYVGPCAYSLCSGKCLSFLPQKSDPHICTCGHIQEFHAAVAKGQVEDDESGLEEGDQVGSEEEDESEDDVVELRAKQLNARYSLSPKKLKSKRKAKSKSKSKSQSVKQPQKRLQQAALDFSGSVSGKKTTTKVSTQSTPASATSKSMKGKAPANTGKGKSSVKAPGTRTVSGPPAATIRPLGSLYLVTTAMDHVLDRDAAGMQAGMVRMTRQFFQRTKLSGKGVKISHRRQPMHLPQDWSMDGFDHFIVNMFPQVFDWVKDNVPADHQGYLWILLLPIGQELHQSACSDDDLNMDYIWDIVFKKDKGFQSSELFIGTVVSIPDKILPKLLGRGSTKAIKEEEVSSEEDSEDDVEEIPAPLAGSSATGLKRKRPAMRVSEPASTKGSKGVSDEKIKQEKHTPEPGSPVNKKAKYDSKPSTPPPASLAATSPTVLDVESPSPAKLEVDPFFDWNPWAKSEDVDDGCLDF
ncbi:hypothetical protein FRC12_004069 [Ceratobasidium sp. 428]|nr:hypothetical protein FRC12_004069 [Ceratobasidium sp. 428]